MAVAEKSGAASPTAGKAVEATVPAALEAVKQWLYKPTLLNGEPVEVVTVIDVNFTLSQ